MTIYDNDMQESGIWQDASELLGIFLKYEGTYESHADLKPEHFGNYGFVYKAIQTVYDREKRVDTRSVIHQLGAEHAMMISNIRQSVIGENRLSLLVDIVKKTYARKQVLNLLAKMKFQVSETDPNELLHDLQIHIEDLIKETATCEIDPKKDFEDFLFRLIDTKESPDKYAGLLTTTIDLDRLTGGWQRTDLIVIGGRTSMGKSAFALSNVLALAKTGAKCAIFSLEMSKHQVYARMAAAEYDIPLHTFKNAMISDESIARISNRESWWYNILIDDTRAVTADYIAERMLAMKKRFGLDFVVVDYLQDIRENGEHNDNTGSALSRICRKLRKAAQECDVALMAMSQVSRDAEKRNADKRPANSDLSGSTGIETSADFIGLLYREDYYNPDTENKNVLELNITKHRNGALGLVKFFYDKDNQRIRALSDVGFTTSHTKTISRKETDRRRSD